MSDPDSPTERPSPGGRRKSIVEMLNPRSNANTSLSSSPGSNATASNPQPVSPPHRRGMSISASLGLGNSAPGQSSPFSAFAKQRRASISTSSGSDSPTFRNSFDDNAVIEEDDVSRPSMNSPPSPSFARRLSFGAQALRDVRQGGGQTTTTNGGGRQPSSSLSTLNEDSDQFSDLAKRSSPATAKAGGEGFNWSDSMRDKTKRSPSISGNSPFANFGRTRSSSAAMADPPKEISKPAPAPTPSKMKKPDHLGERMLRGDFMMD